MAMYQQGENVALAYDGRKGVVREVEDNSIRENAYLVKWFDGGEDWVSERELNPA